MLNYLLLVVFAPSIAFGDVFTPELEEIINDFVNNIMECRNFTGMSLAVVRGNESWTRGFGIADQSSGTLSNNDTLFAIGSLSKAFTSALLAIILNGTDGQYNFDSKLKEIFSKDFHLNGEFRTSEVTIKDILSHRTGLSGCNLGLFAGYPDTVTRKDLTRRLQYMPEDKPFRDTFLYNNNLYMLAGYAAEVLGGKSWEESVRENIFNPLGMDSSTVFTNAQDFEQNTTARPYTVNSNGTIENRLSEIYKISPAEPAGAILSSANDMTKWLQLMLSRGQLQNGTQLINSTYLAEGFKSISVPPESDKRTRKRPEFPVDDILLGYGYAWFQSTYRGYIRQWHSGGVFSYISLAWFFPDLDIGLFASTNGPGSNSVGEGLAALFYYIMDTILEVEPWLNQTTACTFPEPWKMKKDTQNKTADDSRNVSLSELASLTGTYGNYLYTDLEIKLNQTSKMLGFKIGRVSGIMHPLGDVRVFRGELIGSFKFLDGESSVKIKFEPGEPVMNLTFTFYGDEIQFSKLVSFNNLDNNSDINSHAEKLSSQLNVLFVMSCFVYFIGFT